MEHAIKETGDEAVAAADTVEDIEFAGWGRESFSIDPCDGAPGMTIRRVNFAQSGCDDFDLWMLFGDVADHADEGAGIEFGFGGNLWAGDTQPELEILLIADENIHMLDDTVQDSNGAFMTARNIPKLGPIVEVERSNCPHGLGSLHGLDNDLGGCRG